MDENNRMALERVCEGGRSAKAVIVSTGHNNSLKYTEIYYELESFGSLRDGEFDKTNEIGSEGLRKRGGQTNVRRRRSGQRRDAVRRPRD